MADKSKIEWTDATWTPIRARRLDAGKVGLHCVKVSPECKNCYAERLNMRNLPHHGTGLEFTVLNQEKVEIFLYEKMLEQPFRWKRGRKIFVCSQTDLFGEFVPFELIDKVFTAMVLSPQHTFQVLTKRAGRMCEYFNDRRHVAVNDAMRRRGMDVAAIRWPLPNVWLGVTAGTQKSADERIPALLGTPAAIRFVSAEPLLEEVDLRGLHGIDWVIAGGESGPGARPMHPDWARRLRDQCVDAGVAFHFKQWGEWAPGECVPDDMKYRCQTYGDDWSDCSDDWVTEVDNGPIVYRIGKKKAGRLLDGQEWSELPC